MHDEGSDITILAFHGNAEDIGYAFELNELLKMYLKVKTLNIGPCPRCRISGVWYVQGET